MKLVSVLILLLHHACIQAQQQFQLAAPYIRYQTIFFDNELSIQLAFEQPGAAIRYTIDQTVPHAKSKLYKKPLLIKQTTTVKAQTFAREFQPSPIEEITFIKNGRPITVDFQPPDAAYPGNGINALTDNKGGITDHTNNTWLGYNTDSVSFIIKPDGRPPLRELLVHLLQNQAGWIFCPSKASVYIKNSEEAAWQLLETIIVPSDKNDAIACKAIRIPFKKVKAGQLKLVLFNTLLPDWHKGAGANSWIFIDEIKVY